MNLIEAQHAADHAARKCARRLRLLRPPAVITAEQTHALLRTTQELAAAVLELDARVRQLPEPHQTRD